MLRILGIDPGLAQTGYGIIDIKNSRLVHVEHGVIKTDSKELISERLLSINNQLSEVIEFFKFTDYSYSRSVSGDYILIID